MSMSNVANNTTALNIIIPPTEDDPDNGNCVEDNTNNRKLNNRKSNNRKPNNRKLNMKKKTVSERDFVIPKFKDYQMIKDYDYKVKFLKEICKYHKQKVSGNKHELNVRLFNYLRSSSYAVKIQRKWRKYLSKIYSLLRGSARFNRKICVNETDFFTLDLLTDIPFAQFYSYTARDNQIYGFDIISLYNLFDKGSLKTTNPYNREPFPNHVRDDIKRIIKLGKHFGENIDVVIETPAELPLEKTLELRAVDIFQEIDNLGNYTNPDWFNSLDRVGLIRYIRELADIWCYRAQLTNEVKREICPPVGNPFRNLNLRSLPIFDWIQLKGISLNIIEHLVKRGNDVSSRALGATYVLCALTLVSVEASESMPWLYHSVAIQ